MLSTCRYFWNTRFCSFNKKRWKCGQKHNTALGELSFTCPSSNQRTPFSAINRLLQSSSACNVRVGWKWRCLWCRLRRGGYLSVEGNGAGLAFGTNALRPGRMPLTAGLNFTADVLKCNKLPPERQDKYIYYRFPWSHLGTLLSGVHRKTHLSAPPVSLRM